MIELQAKQSTGATRNTNPLLPAETGWNWLHFQRLFYSWHTVLEHFATSGCDVTWAWDLWFVHVCSTHPSSIWGVKGEDWEGNCHSETCPEWLRFNRLLVLSKSFDNMRKFQRDCGCLAQTCADGTGRGMRAKTSSTESEAKASCGWQFMNVCVTGQAWSRTCPLFFRLAISVPQFRCGGPWTEIQSTLAVEWAALCWLRTTVWGNEAFCCKSRTAQKAHSYVLPKVVFFVQSRRV